MNNISSEMLRGHIDTIILLSLLDSDKHTGQIKEEIETRSAGQFELKQGTFYSCLQRIVKQGYVTEYRVSTPEGRKKFYQLTEKGKVYIDDNKDKWCFSRQIIDTLIQTPEVKDEKSIEVITNLDKQSGNVVEEEISPEDTLKQFLDGKTTIEKSGSSNTKNSEDNSTEFKGSEKDLNAEKVEFKNEEKTGQSTKSGGYDLFTYLDYTQSYPIDESVYTKQKSNDNLDEQPTLKKNDEKLVDNYSVDTNKTGNIEQLKIDVTDLTDVDRISKEHNIDDEKLEHSNDVKIEQQVLNTEIEDSTKKEDFDVEENQDFYPDDKVASREYRSVLSKLFPEKKDRTEILEEPRELVYTEGTDVNSFFHDTVTIDDDKLQEMQRQAKNKKKNKFSKQLSKTKAQFDYGSKKNNSFEGKNSFKNADNYDFADIKSLAEKEGFCVKISSTKTRMDAGKIMINKLVFHSALEFFCILVIETLIMGITTASMARLSFIQYLIFGLVCGIFPLVYGIVYIVNPKKRINSVPTFKSTIELIIIIMLNLCLVLFCCCIFAEIDFSNPAMLLRCVFYPLLLLLNIPVYSFIKYLKLDNNKRYFS